MPTIPQPKKKRFSHTWWFWVLIVVSLAVVASIVAGVMQSKNTSRNEYQTLQEKISVERRDLKRTVAANGTLEADAHTSLALTAGGTITDVAVSVGQEVTKNDVLVQTNFEKLKAPFDGRVLSLDGFEGQIATPGMPVVVVGYRSSHIEFFASENEVLELATGQAATVKFPAYKNGRDEFTGHVSFVDVQKAAPQSVAQSGETGYLVKVSLDSLPSEVVSRVGLTADVEVEVGAKTDVLSLESGAIQYTDAAEPFVYLVPTIDDAFVTRAKATDDLTTLLEKKTITTGFEADQYVEITSGLNEGDEVLLYIPQQVSSGLPF